MDSVNKAVMLYECMAERCANGNFSKNQAKIYDEISQFVSDCSSIEDVTKKIKNSKYYIAPSEALVRDKIEAKIKAAKENNMSEVVSVYMDKLTAIDKDQSEIYSVGYETKANNIKTEYIDTYQAFFDIFISWLSYCIEGNDDYLKNIKDNISRLKRPSSNFTELANIQIFRDMIPCTDKGYEVFVDNISKFIEEDRIPRINELVFTKEKYKEENADDVWNFLKNHKKQVEKCKKPDDLYDDRHKVKVIGTRNGYIDAENGEVLI